MNLCVISGILGPVTKENVFKRGDGATVVDGHIKKFYNIGDNLKETRFFYTISGSKADKLLSYYKEGDKVIISGKLVSRVDEEGRYWYTINATSIAKLDEADTDL